MPGEPLPIACTLGPGDLRERVEQWNVLIAAHGQGRTSHEREIVLRFDHAAADELETLVAAERECCAFLTWQVERGPEAVVLRITGEVGALPSALAATDG